MARAREIVADGFRVPQRLAAGSGGACELAQLHQRVVGLGRESAIDPAGEPLHHLGANDIKRALEDVEHQRQDREREQRRQTPARQDAIVDLQHVERARQRQQIDDAEMSTTVGTIGLIPLPPVSRMYALSHSCLHSDRWVGPRRPIALWRTVLLELCYDRNTLFAVKASHLLMRT